MSCPHNSKIGDNYGMSCADCGEQLEGYGYGGWFGTNLSERQYLGEHIECKHQWLDVGGEYEVCTYCQAEREKI